MANVVAASDLAQRLAVAVAAADRLPFLVFGQFRCAAEPDAARLGAFASFTSADAAAARRRMSRSGGRLCPWSGRGDENSCQITYRLRHRSPPLRAEALRACLCRKMVAQSLAFIRRTLYRGRRPCNRRDGQANQRAGRSAPCRSTSPMGVRFNLVSPPRDQTISRTPAVAAFPSVTGGPGSDYRRTDGAGGASSTGRSTLSGEACDAFYR